MTRTRIVTVVLVVSLAINLLFIGIVVGRHLAGPRMLPPPIHFGWVLRELPAERRAELRPYIEEQVRELAPLRRKVHIAQRELTTVLKREEPDDAELAAASTALQDASQAFQTAMHKHMLANMQRLTTAERRLLVTALERRARRPHGERPLTAPPGPGRPQPPGAGTGSSGNMP